MAAEPEAQGVLLFLCVVSSHAPTPAPRLQPNSEAHIFVFLLAAGQVLEGRGVVEEFDEAWAGEATPAAAEAGLQAAYAEAEAAQQQHQQVGHPGCTGVFISVVFQRIPREYHSSRAPWESLLC